MRRLEIAEKLKYLCIMSNDVMKMKDGTLLDNGWQKIESRHTGSNFKGILYEKDGIYVICFLGTDKKSPKDWGANIRMGVTGMSQQIKDAKSYCDYLIDTYKLNSNNTMVIGHSEGGTEATHVGVHNDFVTFTYNAFAAWKTRLDLKPGRDYKSLITDMVIGDDPVSKARDNIGAKHVCEVNENVKMPRVIPWWGTLKAHPITAFGDCRKALPVEEYKEKNPQYVDNIEDAEFTDEDIGKMERKIFELYEHELMHRLEKQQIPLESRFRHSGRVKVDSYYRADGTFVQGHYRRYPQLV